MADYLSWIEGLIKGNSPWVFMIVFIIGFISSLTPHMISMAMMFTGYFIDKNIQDKKTSIIKSLVFSLYFVIVLGITGLLISLIGYSLHGIMKVSYLVSSIILLVLGLRLLGIRILKGKIPIKVTYMYVSNKTSIFSPIYILFSILFTHCSIPFVISILTLATLKDSLVYSMLLVILFGFGHSLIFILGGVSSTLLNKMRKKSKIGNIIIRIYALLLIVLSLSLLLKVLG